MKKKSLGGFTIVELLVVIAVIGVLAAITIVAYNGVQDRARAVALAGGMQDVEKAFQLLALDQNATTWFRDTAFSGVNNPNLDDLLRNTDPANDPSGLSAALKKYIQQVPSTSGYTATWIYDNDGDTRPTGLCDTNWTGVVLAVQGVPSSVSKIADASIDDGNSTCGKVRISGTTVLYQLSNGQSM